MIVKSNPFLDHIFGEATATEITRDYRSGLYADATAYYADVLAERRGLAAVRIEVPGGSMDCIAMGHHTLIRRRDVQGVTKVVEVVDDRKEPF